MTYFKFRELLRGGASVARVAHNHEVAGSIPAPVTISAAGQPGHGTSSPYTAPGAMPPIILSAAAAAAMFLVRRKSGPAPELAGHSCFLTGKLTKASCPRPARFFWPSVVRNRRAHRLAGWLSVSPQLRRMA